MVQTEAEMRAPTARLHRGWASALLALVLLANLALTWHHYALAEHQSQETCHVCLSSSAPAHSAPAAPGVPADRLTQTEPGYADSFVAPESPKGFYLARAPPPHLA
jgi:hypothetical protein